MRISDWSSDVCSSDLAHPTLGDLRVGKDPGDVVDRPRGHAVGIERERQRLRVPACDSARKQRDQRLAVGEPRRIGRETRIVSPAGFAQYPAELAKLAIVTDRDHQFAVGRGESLIGNDLGVAIAHALWRLAARSDEHTSELQSLTRISYAV